jgi:hypothetical protein
MTDFSLEFAKAYLQKLIEAAEHYRRLKRIRAGQPSLLNQFFSHSQELKGQFKQIPTLLTKVEVTFEGWFRNRFSH